MINPVKTNIKEKDIIIIQFPRGEYTNDQLMDISDELETILPHNSILFLPDNFSISIIEQSKGNLFL